MSGLAIPVCEAGSETLLVIVELIEIRPHLEHEAVWADLPAVTTPMPFGLVIRTIEPPLITYFLSVAAWSMMRPLTLKATG